MKTRMFLTAFRSLAVILLIVPSICFGQSRVPIYLVITIAQNDSIGPQLVYEIKEAIRRSSGYRLEEDSKRWPYIRYSIVTLADGDKTVLSHSFSYDTVEIPMSGALITSSVSFCGRNVTASCASEIMGNMDTAVTQLKRIEPDLWKRLQ